MVNNTNMDMRPKIVPVKMKLNYFVQCQETRSSMQLFTGEINKMHVV